MCLLHICLDSSEGLIAQEQCLATLIKANLCSQPQQHLEKASQKSGACYRGFFITSDSLHCCDKHTLSALDK